ncbi:DUF1007 family protein [Phaeospirillum tilakii]|uniref:DUF1007 family protein n=1 Tax=Phaeospirillum tilakii TaxID=741673 RepID=A0ABW5C5N9_9PROT
MSPTGRAVVALGLALLALAPGHAAAHPHAWIDISVAVRFDADGRVTGLAESWLFDEFYSADTVGKGDPARIDRLIKGIMRNLAGYGYFTRVHAGGREIALAPPPPASARMEAGRLRMDFLAPLAEPVIPTQAAPLTYAVFDPTYFIEMLHAEAKDAIRLEGAPPGCRFRLLQPHPDPKAVAAAAALDRTQSGGDGLGAQFAEKVEITCEASPRP